MSPLPLTMVGNFRQEQDSQESIFHKLTELAHQVPPFSLVGQPEQTGSS